MELIKIASLFYLLFYYVVIIGVRSYLLYKNTGINAITSKEKQGMEGFIEKVFMVCLFLISVIVLNFVFLENNYQWLIPITYLENLTVGYLGIGLSFVGIAIGAIAQLQMGNSWRLGLKKNEKTNLVLKGFFKYSRNPIYLGALISYIGFFMMMPNALSFAFLAVSYVALEIKIRLEEQYLEGVHSIEYSKYKSSVRRWI